MLIKRRHFMALAGLAAGSALVRPSFALALDAKAMKPFSDVKLKGKLHTVGMYGHKHPKALSKDKKTTSVLNTTDLVTGKTIETPLPMGEGHSAMGVGDGRIFVCAHHKPTNMVVDPDHKIIKVFDAGENYVYGGHAKVSPNGEKVIFVPKRHRTQKLATDFGRFEVYDLATLNKLDEISSGALHPHEVHTIPGTDEIAVTHYGDIFVRKKPFAHNIVDAKLTIHDAKTLKIKREFNQTEFNALLTHMRVAADKYAYCVLTQYINFDKSVGDMKDQLAFARSELVRVMGHEPSFAIPFQSSEDRQIAIPLPFLRINTQTGEREVLMTGEGNHLRSQSVAYHTQSGKAVAVYSHSDTLVLHKGGEKAEVVHAAEIGLSEIRGASDIPGTPYLAVHGLYAGVSIIDINTRKVVGYYKTENYYSPHIDFADV